jgi:hypothetical protein
MALRWRQCRREETQGARLAALDALLKAAPAFFARAHQATQRV